MTYTNTSRQTAEPARDKYLDGLRGLSILPVLIGHSYDGAAFPAPLAVVFAADLGVRVFFVVSGFIITKLLIAERNSIGRVRLKAFYGRRASKLLPVLWSYVLAIAVVQQFVNLDCSPAQLGAAALLATGFFAQGTWFVGHVWSLTVEEVFYVSWAPVLAFTSKRMAVWVALGLTVLAVAIRGLNIAARSNSLSHVFAWWAVIPVVPELDGVAIGSLAALVGQGSALEVRQQRPWLHGGIQAFVWFLVCAAAVPVGRWSDTRYFFWIDSVLRSPIVALAIAAIIVLAADRSHLRKRSWLEAAPLVLLGRASYSIYIVQQALCVPRQWRPNTWAHQTPTNIGLAVILGSTVFWFLEDPVRRMLVHRFRLSRR